MAEAALLVNPLSILFTPYLKTGFDNGLVAQVYVTSAAATMQRCKTRHMPILTAMAESSVT
eukprot:1153476-Pelagomonas_calceolata.AAC.1